MKKIVLPICLLFLLSIFGYLSKNAVSTTLSNHSANETYKVLLDAGHGGSDPGKIGIDQSLEKDINLAITLATQKILRKKGVHVVLTRTDDNGLYEPNDSNKKISDLKRRRSIIENADIDLAVSIHQNSYPSESIFGGQVFYYSTSESGKQLAQHIQNELGILDSTNKRQIKASSNYYILKSGRCPIVIVECGFLSNFTECSKLNTPAYQKKIANAIATGILHYLTSINK